MPSTRQQHAVFANAPLLLQVADSHLLEHGEGIGNSASVLFAL
jgi:hypothetical protein